MSVKQQHVVDGLMPMTGHFLVRTVASKNGRPQTLFMGLLEGDGYTQNEDHSEIWVSQLIVARVDRFKLDRSFWGWDASDIISEPISLKDDATPIKE